MAAAHVDIFGQALCVAGCVLLVAVSTFQIKIDVADTVDLTGVGFVVFSAFNTPGSECAVAGAVPENVAVVALCRAIGTAVVLP